jgi:type VI secretion system protein ImpG
MTFNTYYQDELTFLRDLGREFAEANPSLAPFLAERSSDPDVERLLEGFAFLTGRIRQRLDDDLPELTHGILSLIYPNFLQPVPATTIMEFTPLANVVTAPRRVDAGVEIDSVPVDGTACRFRTAAPVDVLPLRVADAETVRRGATTDLRVHFKLLSGANAAELGNRPLRLHFHGDLATGRSLYLWSLHYLEGVTLELDGGRSLRFGPEIVRAAGFDADEALLPFPTNAFQGYRILQEYFTLPERFLFVDIARVLRAVARAQPGGFALVFHYSRPLDEQVRPRAENVRLHCVPAINLFTADADPVRVDHAKTQYRVRPASREPSHAEVVTVDRVEGWSRGSARRRSYHRFESFAFDTAGADTGFYRVRLQPSLLETGVESYIAFVDRADRSMVPECETVSLGLTCCNRHLPAKLRAGDIHVPTGTSPEFVTYRNLAKPAPAAAPPLDKGLMWLLISNLSLNYVSLGDVDALRVVLSAYNFRAFHDRQAEREQRLRLEGIVETRASTVDRLHRGMPVRGLRTELTLRESKFAGEGEMYLFATVLNQFFSLYASINAFHQLVVRGADMGEIYEWPPTTGQQPIL